MGKSEEISKNDGRKYNKRLVPKPISSKDKLIKTNTTKAKRDRIASYAVNAMNEEFGSEKDFFKFLAQQARINNQALKLFLEYAYGKPSDSIDKAGKVNTKTAPIINFNMNATPSLEKDNTIDITDENY